MKYLSDYMEERQTAAFRENGAFFAFSNEQLAKEKVEGVTYVNMGSGLICPKDNTKKLRKELDTIWTESIAQDLAENGKSGIILRELYNHEAFYVGEIDNTVRALEPYKFTEEEILAVYRKNYNEACKNL